MKYILYFSAMGIACLSLQSIDRQIKRIRQHGQDLEFYILPNKSISPKKDRAYYWFSHGSVHHTVGDYEGDLLDGEFSKFSNTYELLEKGKFNEGLKEGVWKNWNSNGSLKEIITYHNGRRSGPYVKYDSIGNIEQKGKYFKDLKHRRWVDYIVRDTIFYKNGDLFTPRIKDTSRVSFLRKMKIFFKNIKLSKTEGANHSNSTNKKN